MEEGLKARLAGLLGFEEIDEIWGYLTAMPCGTPKEMDEWRQVLFQFVGESQQSIDLFRDIAANANQGKERRLVSGHVLQQGKKLSQKERRRQRRQAAGGGAFEHEEQEEEKEETGPPADQVEINPSSAMPIAQPGATKHMRNTTGAAEPMLDLKRARAHKSPCGCMGMAPQHTVLTNCVRCGKVVCSHEGWGCCSFCGSAITPVPGGPTPRSTAREAARRSQKKEEQESGSAAMAAQKQKNKLLRFDREAAERTQVFDAQADYYESSNFMSDAEVAAADEAEQRKREQASKGRREIRVCLDIAGRRVLAQGDLGADTVEAFAAEVDGPRCLTTQQHFLPNNAIAGKRASALYAGLHARLSALAPHRRQGCEAAPAMTKLQHDHDY